MNTVTLRLSLTPILLVTLLSGCISSGDTEDNLPIHAFLSPPNVPFYSETQIALQIKHRRRSENYLLVISRERRSFSMRFLTPQGLPVSNAELENGQLTISQKIRSGDLLKPRQILRYLELAYLAEPQGELAENWSVESFSSERTYHYRNTASSRYEGINITYDGHRPWYSSIVILNELNDVSISLTILEVATVLPE
jgi:hypothetical protein